MGYFKVCLIEALEERALAVCKKLNEGARTDRETQSLFCYEWMKGTERKERGGRQFLFYGEGILDEIGRCHQETLMDGGRMGLLLGVLLTEEELDRAGISYYAHAALSREIYSRYGGRMPVYIITPTAAFGGQSGIIMGKDLSGRFISTRNVIGNTSQEALGRMLRHYEDFREKN